MLSDLIAKTMRRNPAITAFHLRPGPGEFGSLVELLATRMPSDHARIHGHYIATHPVDADPPTSLHFTSTKPKPANFKKGALHKDAAKRKLFPFDSHRIGGRTLPIYSLPSRSEWEGDGDGPGLTPRIFNHNRPAAGRTEDPPDHRMVWGEPQDISHWPPNLGPFKREQSQKDIR